MQSFIPRRAIVTTEITTEIRRFIRWNTRDVEHRSHTIGTKRCQPKAIPCQALSSALFARKKTSSLILVDFIKGQMERTEEHQVSFDQMKALLAKEALLTFPDFKEEFQINANASKHSSPLQLETATGTNKLYNNRKRVL